MTPLPVVHVLLASTALLLIGWLVQRRAHNAGIADLLWAASIAGAALYYGVVANGSPVSQMLVALMGGIWGFRLIMHLLGRMLAEREDARYRFLRQRWGDGEMRLLGLFVLRAFSAAAYSIPLYVAAGNPTVEAGPWTILAAFTYLIGLSGEAYSDMQLTAFRAQPRFLGHTCRVGFWRYSRHPNYLFGCIHWFSYVFLAVGVAWPLWALSLLGPLLTMAGWFWLIPEAEAQAIRTRGDDYRQYRAATSMLLPWLPRGWPNDLPDMSIWRTPVPASRVTTPVLPLRTPSSAYRLPETAAAFSPPLKNGDEPR